VGGFPSLGESAAVSADGNTAILGGANDSSYAGASWVFTRTGGAWNNCVGCTGQPQPSKLVGTGAVGTAEQGLSVAISADGNTAIVGGPFDNIGVGAAWVFTRTNGTWNQQGNKLVGSGAAGMALAGTSVALSADGNTAAIGGPFDGGGVGAVWIFTRSNGVWTQQGSKLTGTDVTGLAGFGSAVGLSADGNTAAIGGPGDNSTAGATWIFTRGGGTWSQQGSKLVGTGAANPAAQGSAVATSGDGNTVVTGGPADTSGSVWVFTRSGSAWSQQGGKLTGGATIGTTRQGWVSLSGDGNTAVVGAPSAGPTVSALPGAGAAGEAFVFTRSAGVWTRQTILVAVVAGNSAAQGASVAISSDASTVIVGAPDDQNGTGSGWAYGPQGVPGATSVTPPSGSGSTQTFNFTVSESGGASKVTVINVLINNVLDGRQACYLAFTPDGPAAGNLYLVDNEGDAAGPYTETFVASNLTLTGIVQNGQCTVTATGSSFSTNGNSATLTLAMAFSPSFAGNKVVYLAAGAGTSSNSGWQALGTWNVPGPAASGPAVSGMSPASSNGLTQTYTFTFTDSNGWQDIGIANILVNSDLDGRHACYLAYVPAGANTGMLHLLVDNPVDAGGPFTNLVLPGTGSISNSQCTISGAGASASGSGNTLTLTLPITFSQSFAGNNIFYLAARNNTLNSGWQAVGTVAVP